MPVPRHASLLRRRPGTGRLLATLAFALLSAGCGRLGRGEATATPEPATEATPRPTVDTAVRRVVTADGALVLPVPPQTLAFPAAGTVLEVGVEPGDRVAPGQLLARMDLLPLDRGVAEARAALASARDQLATLEEGPPASEVETARAEVARAEAALAAVEDKVDIQRLTTEVERAKNTRWAAQSERDSVCGLVDAGLAQQSQCDSAQANVQAAGDAVRIAQQNLTAAEASWPRDRDAARSTLAAARDRLRRAGEGASATEMAAARARVDQAEKALQQSLADRQAATITAPFAGEVDQVHVAEGVRVAPGSPAVTLVKTGPLRFATTNLGERNVGAVRRGAKATVTLNAFPDRPLKGSVDRVSSRASEAGAGTTVFTVYVTVKNPRRLALRAGMTGRVEIETR